MGILCVRQKDIKVIIAYSSVCHIAMVIAALRKGSLWALKGAILIIVAHGLSSSGLFGIAFFPYLGAHSRSILILKNNLVFSARFITI